MQDFTAHSDRELVGFLQAGNENAFTELYNRYWKIMFAIAAKKCGSFHDAEGIVQDIFLDLWQRRSRLEIKGELRSYLSVAVKFKVINVLAKRNKQRHHVMPEGDIMQLPDCSTEQWLNFEELKDRLSLLTSQLPKKCRLIYRLKKEEGLSQKQISEKLDISEKTVEAHVSRALKIFRKEITQYLQQVILLLF